jgi:hypothetical protein
MNEPKRMWKIPAAIYFFHGLAADPMNIFLRNSIRKSSISRTLCIPRKLLQTRKQSGLLVLPLITHMIYPCQLVLSVRFHVLLAKATSLVHLI